MTLPTRCGRLLLTWLMLGLCVTGAQAQSEWPRWRGPADNGSAEGGTYPVRWTPDKVLWKAELPGKGCSTPIVHNRRIYVTAPADGHDALVAFDWSGAELWRARFGPEDPGRHRNGSGSNASPSTDGRGVFVYFKSGTLAAVELDGRVRWQTNLVERFGRDQLFWDQGTTPVLTSEHVVMARMHHGDSWLAAFDKRTGEMRWKVARNYETPTEGDHGYSTPLVIEYRGAEALLVWGAEHLTIHDAASGKELGSCDGFNPDASAMWPAIATPVVVDNVAILAYGRNDREQPRLHGVRLDGAKPARLWMRQDTGTFVPTPAEHGGRLYLLRDRGQVECLDPVTGKTVWAGELPRNRASYYASPVIAGGKLYAAREDGVVFVAAIDGRFELLAENPMHESVIASVVPVENRLLIRGEQHLFCVGQ